jgi:ribonuclease P protein component
VVWRVSDRATFEQLRRRARRGRSGPVAVSFWAAEGASRPKVAYSVGRRVGNAVERNLLRRRLRAVIRQLAPQMLGGSYMVSAAPDAKHLDHRGLVGAVEQALIEAAAMGGANLEGE